MAAGSLASICSTVNVWGTISEYTFASRTRRAMSWAYCAPKSTTMTGRGVWGWSLADRRAVAGDVTGQV